VTAALLVAVMACGASAVTQPVDAPVIGADQGSVAPAHGARLGARDPSLEVLGAGRVTRLAPVVGGVELWADGPEGPLRWAVDGARVTPAAATTAGAAAAEPWAVERDAAGWRVGSVALDVRCQLAVRGAGAVGVPGGGVVLDPCGGALVRWGEGWRLKVEIGAVGEDTWLVGAGEVVGVVREGAGGLQWRGWPVAALTPVASSALPLPGGARVVARGIHRREAPAGFVLDVRLPEGLTVVDVAMVDGGLVVAGSLDVGGVVQVALARAAGP
jgi:hypothetical protein